MKVPGTNISGLSEPTLKPANEIAQKTLTHEQYMEKLKPRFLAGMSQEIERAADHAKTKLEYTKGQYPYDLAVYVADEIKALGYKYEVNEETLTIQWKDEEKGN